ncbi:sieve element occlusion protein, partial [Trifolium medium]|nr:sieve element occlusion protein [Trifolium medium]
MDIHNDKADDIVQHQEPETNVKQFIDEHDDSEDVPETQVEKSTSSYPTAIPATTQKIVILPDLVQTNLRVIKQVWAVMGKGEKSFTPFISKSQKKKKKQLAWSAGQPYNTRSTGMIVLYYFILTTFRASDTATKFDAESLFNIAADILKRSTHVVENVVGNQGSVELDNTHPPAASFISPLCTLKQINAE